jgi:hypothetical protein
MARTRILVSAAAVLSIPALAIADPPPPRAAAFQAVLDCRAITGDAARLACYDAAAGRMASAETSGDIVVIDKEQARAANRQAFGLSLPSLDFITRGLSKDETERVEGEVRSASVDGLGKWVMILRNGAVWRQVSSETLSRDPRPGSKVEIRRASLGSYMMKIDGRPAIRVHREQ